MSDVLDEAAALVQCKECPWYRTCVVPLRFTAEDMHRQMQSALPGLDPAAAYALPGLIANMAQAAQSLLLEGCPIFIERLRASPKLAERIKAIMQSWGKEASS